MQLSFASHMGMGITRPPYTIHLAHYSTTSDGSYHVDTRGIKHWFVSGDFAPLWEIWTPSALSTFANGADLTIHQDVKSKQS